MSTGKIVHVKSKLYFDDTSDDSQWIVEYSGRWNDFNVLIFRNGIFIRQYKILRSNIDRSKAIKLIKKTKEDAWM